MIKEVLNGSKIAVVGLGYVGLPLALSFSEHINVIGYDINQKRIEEYKNLYTKNSLTFTSDVNELKDAICYIFAIPTPVDENNHINIDALKSATYSVGQTLEKGNYVIYESTVYPGLTEEVCVPILEQVSTLKCPEDFKIGYSPERINVGDTVNTLDKITKIVSGIDEESKIEIQKLYSIIMGDNTHLASSIKVAEAAKILENTQRDVNIAFINEMAMLFDKMGIDTYEVLEAAGTKWNFHNYYPGLVGGHCIAVDPYYLIEKAKTFDYLPQIAINSRLVNESVPEFIVEKIKKIFEDNNLESQKQKILILGYTFRENIDDIRNTKVDNLIYNLANEGMDVSIADPYVEKSLLQKNSKINAVDYSEYCNYDMLILAVAHDEFKNISINDYKKAKENGIIIDIKKFFDKNIINNIGIKYWRF